MRDLLTKYGIPTDTLVSAVHFLNEASEKTVKAFNAEFGLTPPAADALSAARFAADALSAARFAADALFRGAAVDKVAGYVGKRLLGLTPQPAPIIIAAAPPIVETETVTVVQVASEQSAFPTVKGKRGRKKLGNSDMCKAVTAIESADKKADRQTLLNCIVAAGIKQASAVVYLWRYNNGERS
jgi:hypothetical protein